MMHLNILHRPEPGALAPFFRMEQDWAHELGLRTTMLVHYPDLFDEAVVRGVREDAAKFGDEIGLALHRLTGPGMDDVAGGLNSIWLHNRDQKRVLLKTALDKYRSVFGDDPVSVAAYHFDASALGILKELAPGVQAVVGGCFEEGVRVFHGCNHSWYLFNEGMPWGPWYPSRGHSLRPAANEADAVGVVAVPHLCRDMSLSYEGRNDFWATHPPNVIRGMGNEATWCPYDLNLIDQYRLQEKFNGGYSYVNTFVSAPWLTWNHNSEYPPEVAQTLYQNQLRYLAELKQQGALQDLTLGEYAAWFRQHRPIGGSEVYWAKELLYGSGKHYVWFIDPSQRVLIDPTQGGAIGDWRPYLGRYAAATGPDTPAMMIGTFPYLIQSQHRTGYPNHCHDGARTTLLVRHGNETVDTAKCRTKCAGIEHNSGTATVRLTPATVRFKDGVTAEIATTYRLEPGGRIQIEREVVSCNQPKATLELTEYVKACYGFTEYPEKLHDVRLNITGARSAAMTYEYRGREIKIEQVTGVRAEIPSVKTAVQLAPASGAAVRGSVAEGHLFSPYFTLTLTQTCRSGQRSVSCLTLNSIG